MKRTSVPIPIVGLACAIALVTLLAATPERALADEPKGPLGYIIPPGCLGRQDPSSTNPDDKKPCGLNEMVEIAVNIARVLLMTLGSATLVMVVYGGFVWLTSAGNAERISQGKKIFEGALIGFVIVLSSWIIINFVIAALTGQSPARPAQLFLEAKPGGGSQGQPAFNLPTGSSSP